MNTFLSGTVCLLCLFYATPNHQQTPDEFARLLNQANQAEEQGKLDDALNLLNQAFRLKANDPRIFSQRGGVQFKLGNFQQSLDDFDAQIKLHPQDGPAHWRRGLTLFYAKKYEDGVRQFKLSDQAEPQDVENAVWHLLCNAQVIGLTKARQELLPVKLDQRVPMMEIHAMFANRSTPEKVLQRASIGGRNDQERAHQLFYAHLYVGLFYDLCDKPDLARTHLKKAVNNFPIRHYMLNVAQNHLNRLSQ